MHASMNSKGLHHIKTMLFYGQMPTNNSNLLFKFNFFLLLSVLYCCVWYLNIEYQDEIFQMIFYSNIKKEITTFSIIRKFCDVKYFECGIYSRIP